MSPPGEAGGNQYIHPRSHSPKFLQLVRKIVPEIRLGKHHHRGGSTIPGYAEIPLRPPKVVVPVQGHADEEGVDVRRHHLFPVDASRSSSDKNAFSGKHMVNDGVPLRMARTIKQQKIPHCGIVRGGLGRKPEFAGNFRRSFSLLRYHSVEIFGLGDNAPQVQACVQSRLGLHIFRKPKIAYIYTVQCSNLQKFVPPQKNINKTK
eukprot:TRINITY_DN9715_c0_g1_i2.p2 TRINITY_DN9715_c0_g1~~TRINITY_DN9715_c0_g1_i2.p2  ORF type:complete len:205 (+),score=5.13 TRINITY_DN9715_c0_g1_i2:154-768(+)